MEKKAYSLARKKGLPDSEAEECADACAFEWLLRRILQTASTSHTLQGLPEAEAHANQQPTLFAFRVDYFVLHYQRAYLRRLKNDANLCHEETNLEMEDEDVHLIRSELSKYLSVAMNHLTTQQQKVIQALFFDDQSLAEVACSRGKSSDAVRKTRDRALKHLKSILQTHGLCDKEIQDYIFFLNRRKNKK